MVEDGLVSTGVAGLNRLLGGGFPRGSNILILGTPGSGKTLFCRQFVYNGLLSGEKVIYLTTSDAPETIINQMAEFGLDIERFRKNIVFVDCYSWRIPESQRGKTKYSVSGPEDLNGINIQFQEILSNEEIIQGKVRVIIDSVSDLLMHGQQDQVFKFVEILGGRLKAMESISFFALEEGIHEPKAIATLNYLMDGVVHLKIAEDKRMVRIEKMVGTSHSLAWLEFRIEHGFAMKIEDFFE